MKTAKAKDVDEYIARSDGEAFPVLTALRKLVKKTVPGSTEGISWNVPFYKYHGPLAGFAVYSKHVSFGIAIGELDANDRQLLEKKGYATGKKTVQIRFNQDLPSAEIERILKTKARIQEGRDTQKELKSAKAKSDSGKQGNPTLKSPTTRAIKSMPDMNAMNPKVDFVFEKEKKWQDEMELLRTIILECPLEEELKWGQPCYTFEKSNIVLIHGFKEYCALLFFKGALLKDPEGILIQQTENVQSARQIRFTGAKEIKGKKAVLKAYIYEAIEVERAGLKVELKKTKDYPVPEELQQQLDKNPALKKAFYALTPGRQRGYLFYFSSAKQSKTRIARIEKYLKKILKGKGMED